MPDLRMPELNKLLLAGNLTREPEMQFLASGTALCKFGIACNRRYKDKEEVLFMDIVSWGKSAEYAAENLHKGSPVMVEGRLMMNTWGEGKERKTRYELNAERIHQLSWPPDGSQKPKLSGAGVQVSEDDLAF